MDEVAVEGFLGVALVAHQTVLLDPNEEGVFGELRVPTNGECVRRAVVRTHDGANRWRAPPETNPCTGETGAAVGENLGGVATEDG